MKRPTLYKPRLFDTPPNKFSATIKNSILIPLVKPKKLKFQFWRPSSNRNSLSLTNQFTSKRQQLLAVLTEGHRAPITTSWRRPPPVTARSKGRWWSSCMIHRWQTRSRLSSARPATAAASMAGTGWTLKWTSFPFTQERDPPSRLAVQQRLWLIASQCFSFLMKSLFLCAFFKGELGGISEWGSGWDGGRRADSDRFLGLERI